MCIVCVVETGTKDRDSTTESRLNISRALVPLSRPIPSRFSPYPGRATEDPLCKPREASLIRGKCLLLLNKLTKPHRTRHTHTHFWRDLAVAPESHRNNGHAGHPRIRPFAPIQPNLTPASPSGPRPLFRADACGSRV